MEKRAFYIKSNSKNYEPKDVKQEFYFSFIALQACSIPSIVVETK